MLDDAVFGNLRCLNDGTCRNETFAYARTVADIFLYICTMGTMTINDCLMLIIRGLGATVVIALASLLLGTLLGLGVYVMTLSKHRWVQMAAKWWKVIVRGMPTLVILLIIFNVLFGGKCGVLAAILAFSINFSNFSAGLFQSSIESVGRGQIDAGRALGLANLQIYRCIVAPQALTNALPALRYQAVTILKGTSIVGYVSIYDLTRATEFIGSAMGNNLLPLVASTIIYFILAWLLNRLIDCVLLKVTRV